MLASIARAQDYDGDVMKHGLFDFKADVKDGVTTLRVMDHDTRVVATGSGANTREAQEQALATTDNDSAKEHLRTIGLPEAPFD